MSDVLQQIVASKRREIAAARERLPEPDLERQAAAMPHARDFRGALARGALVRESGVAVIAEVKKASPSAGIIQADFDPVAIARAYERGGAACLSVLTDAPYFQGSLDDLRAVRAAVGLPVLRKDFVLERYQLLEARCAGADAVLLIAEILPGDALARLLHEANDLGLQALVELYERENLPRVLAAGATLVGVNNRDLRTFVTRLEHTLEVAAAVPAGVCLVSESGIRGRADVEKLLAAGVHAVLVGETLMRSADPGAAVAELLGIRRALPPDEVTPQP
jgi:indole-3-glycerol phosphate synthase